jgi:hypothetical protein
MPAALYAKALDADAPRPILEVKRVSTASRYCDESSTAFRAGVTTQWINTVVRRSGSTLRWGIDGPQDILGAVPGTRAPTM